MERTTTRDVAATVAAGAGVLLLAALSAGWHRVKVEGGPVTISATTSGWSGAGLVAGLLTIAMLVYMIRPLRRSGSIGLLHAAATAILGVGVAGFTVDAAIAGSGASVTAPAAAVQIGSRLWPAYAAIAVGVIVAAGAVIAFVLVLLGATSPSRLAQPTS